MIGTAAARALSRNSPKGAVILLHTCFGSSQRAFMSSTRIAVLLLSRVTGLGSGRLGPSSAANSAAEKTTQRIRTAEEIFMADSPFIARTAIYSPSSEGNSFPQLSQVPGPLHFIGEAVVVERFGRRVGRGGAI